MVFGLNYFERDELLFARVSTLLRRVNFFGRKGTFSGAAFPTKQRITWHTFRSPHPDREVLIDVHLTW